MSIIDILKKFFVKEEVRNFGIPEGDIGMIADSPNIVLQDEVVAKISTPTFKGVKQDGSIRKFLYQYQYSCSGCVAFTKAKIAMILYFLLKGAIVRFSPGFDYAQRKNKNTKNSLGMFIDDIINIGYQKGCLPNEFLPSEGLSEDGMNALNIEQYQLDLADAFKMPEHYVEVPVDFDRVASTIEATKKGMMAWFEFGPGEFFSVTKPKTNGNSKPWRHSITLLDTAIIDGVKVIVAEDSADQEAFYQKYITREFFERCILVRYPKNFTFADDSEKPVFNGSIISMQECLIYEKLLQSEANTGFIGTLTKQALILFQKKYKLEPSIGNFGPLTKAKLTELYS